MAERQPALFDKYIQENVTSSSMAPSPRRSQPASDAASASPQSSTEASAVPSAAPYGSGKPVRKIIKGQIINVEGSNPS